MSSQKLPSGLEVDEPLEDQVAVDRAAVGRQAHQLVLAAVDLEAAIVGERGIEQTQRVRECDVVRSARSGCPRRRRTWRCSTRRRRRGSGSRPPRTGEGKKALAAWLSWWSVKTSRRRGSGRRAPRRRVPPHVQLVLQPERHGQAEAAEPGRGIGQVGLQQPLELGQRLVVEGDVIEVVRGRARPRRGSRRRPASGNAGSCLFRVNRSSCAAATIRPSTTRAAALS